MSTSTWGRLLLPLALFLPSQICWGQAKLSPAEQAADAMAQLLEEPFGSESLQGTTKLKDVLAAVSKALDKRGKQLPISIDEEAFKAQAGGAEVPDLYEMEIKLALTPKTRLRTILEHVLKRIPPGNATYLIRAEDIEITTATEARPDRRFIRGKFHDQPLEEALRILSAQSGITIVVDARAREKAKSPVTATFRTDTNLLTAVELLADGADLKAVTVDDTIYVTTTKNPLPFLQQQPIFPEAPAPVGGQFLGGLFMGTPGAFMGQPPGGLPLPPVNPLEPRFRQKGPKPLAGQVGSLVPPTLPARSQQPWERTEVAQANASAVRELTACLRRPLSWAVMRLV